MSSCARYFVEVYARPVGRLAATGAEGEAWMRGAIDLTKQSLGVAKEIPPNQIFDFSVVEKAGR